MLSHKPHSLEFDISLYHCGPAGVESGVGFPVKAEANLLFPGLAVRRYSVTLAFGVHA